MNIVGGTVANVMGAAQNIIEKGTNSVLGFITGDTGAFQNMVVTLNKLSDKSAKLGKLNQIRLLACYDYLQDIILAKYPDLIFGSNPINTYPINTREKENYLIQSAADANFYCRYAAGAYGDSINYVLSGQNVAKIFDTNNQTDEFLKIARCDKNQLVYANWQSVAYLPAHAIVLLRERKELLLVIRGSFQAGDFVTDLIATYLNFSVMEDPNGNRYLRINSEKEIRDSASNFKDTRAFIENRTADTSKDKEVYSGKAHSGIFYAGLEVFSALRERIEGAFDKLPKDYNFVITGHSLGGGMTQILTFLFLIHPLKYFGKADLKDRVKGFAFAPPPLFSLSLAPVLEGHLFNFHHHFDLVPKLCYGSLKDLDSALVDLSERERTDELMKKIMDFDYNKKEFMMSDTELTNLEHYKNVYIELKEKVLTNEKLFHLGKSFWIVKPYKKTVGPSVDPKKSRKDKITYNFERIVSDQFYANIIICKDMINHHFPNLYQEGLCHNIVFK